MGILLWDLTLYVITIVVSNIYPNLFMVLATNDITVTYNDNNYLRSLMLCQEHTESVFRTFNRLGDITFWRGAYLITDGGYPMCYSFLNPNLLNYDYQPHCRVGQMVGVCS